MNCKRCGKEVNTGMKYCPACGAEVQSEPAEAGMKQKNSRKKKMQAAIACICCAVLVISATVGAVILNRDNDAGQSTSDENYVYLDSGFSDVEITDSSSALEAISSVKDMIGIENAQEELKSSSMDTVTDHTYYRFQQYYKDIPVYGRNIVVVSDADGQASLLTSNYININDISNTEINVIPQQVQQSVNNYFETSDIRISEIDNQNIIIYSFDDDRKPVLAYRFVILYNNVIYEMIADAKNAEILSVRELVMPISEKVYSSDSGKATVGWKDDDGSYLLYNEKYNISIFDVANINTRDENGEIKEDFTEYGISTISSNTNKFDEQAIILLDNMIKFNEFYNELGDKGFDSVHAAINCSYDNGNNASGGGIVKNDKRMAAILVGSNMETSQMDVLGHEYTHAITGSIIDLNDSKSAETGAISEGISDIFGELIEGKFLKKNIPDWSLNNPVASLYRNISDPQASGNKGKITDSSKIDSKYEYSTVISHAAYLMWNGGESGLDIFKIDIDKLAHLWYRSLYIMQSDATFNQCANAVILTAETMQNSGDLTQAQVACVRRAFESVGIYADMHLSLTESSTNGAKVNVIDINGNPLSNYYLKVTDQDSNIIVDGEFTTSDLYIIDVDDNGIYYFTAKETKSSSVEFNYKVRILNTYRENSILDLQTSLNLEITDLIFDVSGGNNLSVNDESVSANITANSGASENTNANTGSFNNGSNSNENQKITWSFDDANGTLTIFGGGKLSSNDVGWSQYRSAITKIVMSDNITEIDSWIFAGYSNIEEVKLPLNLIKIENHAFDDVSNLKEIKFFDNLVEIGEEAFKNCKNLKNVNIPNSVTSLGGSAFSGCSSLRTLSIGEGLKSLPFSAFSGNSSLESVEIPDNINSIELYAFSDCTNLKKVVIGNGVTVIGAWAFSNCTSLTDITLGDNVVELSLLCFSNCTSLNNIVLPKTLVTIGEQAFKGCINLKSISIPKSVKTIGAYALNNCKSLTDIYYSGTKAQWSDIEKCNDYGDTDKILANVKIHYS